MVVTSSLQLSNDFGIHTNYGLASQPKCRMGKGRLHFITMTLSSTSVFKDAWKLHSSSRINKPRILVSSKCGVFLCQSVLLPSGGNDFPVMEKTAMVLKRMCSSLSGTNLILHLVPAISILAFAAWGLGPLMRLSFNLFPNKTEASWKKSSAYHLMTSYVQPLLLCTGAMLICRSLDPIILPSEASQAVKQRLLRFVQSLSIVLAFAYCLSSLIQHAQKFFMETSDTSDARNLGFQFAGKAVYTAVWIAAISLFMELLGFSTQKWLTAGGLGTVLLTLAGREIFTNFLSSVMIHSTRPFVLNDWIQTKIEGYEVSGTVEHVGWWSPTIIRGDDREAVHIPNHKFTVNVVRNLSQKTHWRIKTHLAISHLDANKINNIVADMRKVLAKNPQVEQQKLHRRVFLDNINPENQALLIMVSCFVKTSHFEEYLCVKEAIVLDLLRVINHHRARLATPMRTIQKVYAGVDVESTPISETIFTQSTAAASGPFLLIDPSYKLSGDDKTKFSSRSVRSNEDKEKSNPATKTDSKFSAASSNASISPASASDDSVKDSLGKHQNKKAEVDDAAVSERDLKDITIESSFKKPPPLSSELGSDGERPVSLATTPTLEENILLGVALEGSKRTLPIEEAIDPSPAESKELASCRNGNGSPAGTGMVLLDDQVPTSSGSGSASAPSDQQEKESL